MFSISEELANFYTKDSIDQNNSDGINKESAITANSFENTTVGIFSAMKERLKLDLEASKSQRKTKNFFATESFPSDDYEESSCSIELDKNSPKNPFERFYKHHRTKLLLKELAGTCENRPDGVHVSPSLKSIQIWYGVIFVRHGPYEEGIFHFNIYFRDTFPDSRPVVRFKSPIFHPLIDGKGDLVTDRMYEGKVQIPVSALLHYTRSCFYHLSAPTDTPDSLFMAKCRASVLDSLLVYDEQGAEDHENPFRCAVIRDQHFLNGVKAFMMGEGLTKGAKKEKLLTSLTEWTKGYLGKMLNNINAYETDSERDGE